MGLELRACHEKHNKISSITRREVNKSQDATAGIMLGNIHKVRTEMNKTHKQAITSHDDPFLVFETTSSSASSSFLDPLEQISKLNNSGGTKGSSNTPSLRPPPKATNVDSSGVSSIDELEEFQVKNNARSNYHASEIKQNSASKTNKRPSLPLDFEMAF
ncbi:auxilin-related protein 2 [Senna tora]|uniref:Auxilin-related protein 2 n=1 Tax=Senna tora TaxID=362788 RepID=A0A834TM83_9FABA|nr:auxilin-related protein 2 [Senna tora]